MCQVTNLFELKMAKLAMQPMGNGFRCHLIDDILGRVVRSTRHLDIPSGLYTRSLGA